MLVNLSTLPKTLWPGIVAHTCNSTTWNIKATDGEFKVSLGDTKQNPIAKTSMWGQGRWSYAVEYLPSRHKVMDLISHTI